MKSRPPSLKPFHHEQIRKKELLVKWFPSNSALNKKVTQKNKPIASKAFSIFSSAFNSIYDIASNWYQFACKEKIVVKLLD